ncbi:hypothetical protein OKW30_003433 [Paraburkholderia sp. Clong3]|uniref:hypothetical protein n=1 Tax=Paraburkholderia sp. Clong3 TaxID=2991061 RepID=UPI003D22AAF3
MSGTDPERATAIGRRVRDRVSSRYEQASFYFFDANRARLRTHVRFEMHAVVGVEFARTRAFLRLPDNQSTKTWFIDARPSGTMIAWIPCAARHAHAFMHATDRDNS